MSESDRAHSRIMGLCARAVLEPALARQLHEVCAQTPSWEHFLRRVEEQAMGPLVHRHTAPLTTLAMPPEIRRGLLGLALRHKASAAARTEALRELLPELARAGVAVLALKGTALAYSTYAEPSLRPQRDIDLLLPAADIARASEILRALGYNESGHAAPHHAPPLDRERNGLNVSIELHHALGLVSLPDYAPLPEQDFAALSVGAVSLETPAGALRVPSAPHVLRHIYRHGLACPMSWRMFHYGALCDLALLLEQHAETLQLDHLQALDAALLGALPALHRVLPLGPRARARFGLQLPERTLSAAELYWGWPRESAGDKRWFSSRTGAQHLIATLFPHYSFLQLRYGQRGKLGVARAWGSHVRELYTLRRQGAR